MSRDELPYCGECGMSHEDAGPGCERAEVVLAAKYPDTPELDKIEAVHEQTQSAGLFLDWLVQNGVTLCKYHDGLMEDGEQDDDNPEGWYPAYMPVQDLLAEWQDIDQKVAEKERVAVLDWVRRQQELK